MTALSLASPERSSMPAIGNATSAGPILEKKNLAPPRVVGNAEAISSTFACQSLAIAGSCPTSGPAKKAGYVQYTARPAVIPGAMTRTARPAMVWSISNFSASAENPPKLGSAVTPRRKRPRSRSTATS